MKVKGLALIISFLCIFFGICFIFIPVQISAVFALSLNNSGTVLTRFYGAILLQNGIVFAYLRKQPISNKIWSFILPTTIFYNLVHASVTIFALLSNQTNYLGFCIFIMDLLIIVFTLYFYLKKLNNL